MIVYLAGAIQAFVMYCVNGNPAVNTWNVALENGADLHVNERQKIRHYCARSTEERRRIRRRNRGVSVFLIRAGRT